MEYQLYGAHGSGSAIVEAALTEIGLSYRFHRIDAQNHAQRDAAYAAVNPHRKMPTLLTPEGETLTETAAILLTLAERHPEAHLLPAEPLLRAQAVRWMIFIASEFYPLVEIMDYPERFAPDESRVAVKAAAHRHWEERWRRVEEVCSTEGPYLLGASLCAPDLQIALLSRWDLPAEVRETHLPRVMRVGAAVLARPTLRDVWRRNAPGAV